MNVTSTSITNAATGAITTITVVHRSHAHEYKLIGLGLLALMLFAAGIYLWRKPIKKK